jgi:hypothetical protein
MQNSELPAITETFVLCVKYHVMEGVLGVIVALTIWKVMKGRWELALCIGFGACSVILSFAGLALGAFAISSGECLCDQWLQW